MTFRRFIEELAMVVFFASTLVLGIAIGTLAGFALKALFELWL